jgi:hypothetical protein
VTLHDARTLGIRRVRRPCWRPGSYLELVDPAAVAQPRPPLESAWHTAVVVFMGWAPIDSVFWRLPWEDYEPLDLRGEE